MHLIFLCQLRTADREDSYANVLLAIQGEVQACDAIQGFEQLGYNSKLQQLLSAIMMHLAAE